MNNGAVFSSNKMDWETPQNFFNQLNEEFHFTLDPSSDDLNHKCDYYFTIEDDGLKQSWEGETVFCNPPYGKSIGDWVKKCSDEATHGDTTVVLLIPARTDTKYFHDYIYQKPNVEVRFVKGRLKFGDGKNSAPFPSMVVIFRPNPRPEEFSRTKENWLSLYPHQRDALDEMHNGCILCGGVGSGKSRTALAYYYREQGGDLYSQKYVEMDTPCDLYIITTAKKRDSLDWEREMGFFLLSSVQNELYSNKIVVDSWNNIKRYENVTDAFFIFDEQRVVGSGAWVKSFLKITKSNKWILLTATPGDTWSDYIPVFLANGLYRNRTDFNEQHVIFNRFTKWPQIDKYIGTKKLEANRNRVLVNMRYERRATCIHKNVTCGYDHVMYKWIYRNRCDPVTGEPFQNASQMVHALRQLIFCDPSRVEALLGIVSIYSKVIVFYNLDCELDILRNIKWPEGVEYAEYNGHKHQDYPDSRRWVYACQYNSCSEAWECTDTNCMVFFSNNYSYKIMVQAAGRIDRNNTPFDELYYYHLTSTSPLDVSIRAKLNNKKTFNERAFLGKEICESFERRQNNND